jgi:hypothetical protein
MNEEARDTMKSILVCAVILALALSMNGSDEGSPLPNWRALPDWHVKDHCYPFSKDFSAACNNAGIPAVRLTYDWCYASGEGDRHCVVLFKWAGSLWLMDNMHSKPWQVKGGATDLAILKRHAVGARRMVDPVTLNPRTPRTMAELFPDLTRWATTATVLP